MRQKPLLVLSLLVMLLTTLLFSPAQAGILSCVLGRIQKQVVLEGGKLDTQDAGEFLIADKDLSRWRAEFSQSALDYVPALNRLEPASFYAVYSHLPLDLRATLDHFEGSAKERAAILQMLRKKLALPGESFLNSYFQFRDLHAGENISELTQKGIRSYEELPSDRKLQITRDIMRRARAEKVSLLWRDEKLFSVPLTIREQGSEVEATIGDHIYSGIRKGAEIVLTVPTELVLHPAWNPIDTTTLIKMARAKVPPPRPGFSVQVGWDGKFYLMDGNKRFELSRNRPATQVILESARTISLGGYLDAIGQLNLNETQIEKLMSDPNAAKAFFSNSRIFDDAIVGKFRMPAAP